MFMVSLGHHPHIYIVDGCYSDQSAVDSTCIHWRKTVRATVKKWGNSAAVRIPASVMRAARLDPGEVVDVREEAGRIIIKPVRQKTYDLRRLLDRITSKNQHERFDTGPVAGKEAW